MSIRIFPFDSSFAVYVTDVYREILLRGVRDWCARYSNYEGRAGILTLCERIKTEVRAEQIKTLDVLIAFNGRPQKFDAEVILQNAHATVLKGVLWIQDVWVKCGHILLTTPEEITAELEEAKPFVRQAVNFPFGPFGHKEEKEQEQEYPSLIQKAKKCIMEGLLAAEKSSVLFEYCTSALEYTSIAKELRDYIFNRTNFYRQRAIWFAHFLPEAERAELVNKLIRPGLANRQIMDMLGYSEISSTPAAEEEAFRKELFEALKGE